MNSRMRTAMMAAALLLTVAAFLALPPDESAANDPAPTLTDRNLDVRAVATGLVTPVSMAFLGPNDMLVLEKNTGHVQWIQSGAIQDTVLDLAVNFASERGLLGIALHPNFPLNPGVYLYWTESSTGSDTNQALEVPLLGNRIDRFVWNGSSLAFDRHLIRVRALQTDAGQPPAGNHNGGVLRFGPDGKLYALVGEVGRRGQLQNLSVGPFGPGIPDDAFGGPEPDDAHLTGVILRLNDDGTTPADNPFFAVGSSMGGEIGQNVQKIFAYGIRNSFGMAADPMSGNLWTAENGNDSFDEINRVQAGMNGGWIQIMGPVARVAEFKEIETTFGAGGLQQLRWPPTNIADTPEEALSRLYALPGSSYKDPEFSWKYAVAPAGLGFVGSRALGPQYRGNLIVGAARTQLEDGYLFRFRLTGNRSRIAVDDPRLKDRVADNLDKFDLTESEDLLFGRGFGVGTDVQTGPNGNLFVVSLDQGTVWEIFRR
jgi:aldose sugar dehydrogenase